MKSALSVAGVFACAILLAAFAPNDAEARYQTLIAAAKVGAQPADWQAIRSALADRPGFLALDHQLDELRTKMLTARRAGDYPEMLKQANLILEQNYADGQAHLLAGSALTLLNEREAGDREHSLSVAIFRSIQTGDGLSAATAFTVISVREEYELMFARQRQVGKQSLQQIGGHAYDVLETVGRSGDAVTFYFLIDRVLAAEAAELKPKG